MLFAFQLTFEARKLGSGRLHLLKLCLRLQFAHSRSAVPVFRVGPPIYIVHSIPKSSEIALGNPTKSVV